MNKDIKIAGATYSGVPAIQIPATDGGAVRYTEVSDTTATAADVASGKVFYDASGDKVAGTADTSGKYDMFFDTRLIDITDEDLPEATAGALTMRYSALNIHSVDSAKVGELAECLFTPNTFSGYKNTVLNEVVLPNVLKVGRGCFYKCDSLTKAILPKLETIPENCFGGCSNLADCDFTNAKTILQSAFDSAGLTANGKTFSFPRVEAVNISCFYHFGSTKYKNTTLKMPAVKQMTASSRNLYMSCVDLGPNLNLVCECFIGGDFLKTVILRATTPPETKSSTIFGNMLNGYVIYVPDASIDAYKAATNWGAYADHFQPLSTYVGGAT